MPKNGPRVLYWFRTDLRLHDSAINSALDLKPECLYPVWCWDPQYVYHTNVGANRFQFLIDSMNDVSSRITQINPKSKLFVLRGPPATVLPALFKQWSITHLVFERDGDDDYTRARDEEIEQLAAKASVKVITKLGRTLYDPEEVIKRNKGKPPLTYNAFEKLASQLPDPPAPLPTPKSLPDPGDTSINMKRQEHSIDKWSKWDWNASERISEDTSYETVSGPNGDFATPTLAELGMKATGPHRGGETRGLEQMQDWLENRKQEILDFEKPKTNPAAFDPPETMCISAHLKFGTVSIRSLYHGVKKILAENPKHSKPPVSFIGQLLFREMFHIGCRGTPNFTQIQGNPICKFIDWRMANQYDQEGKLLPRDKWELDAEDKIGEEYLAAWKEGRTGFPWIDAIMRQLKIEGWIHHLARHSVACFLTRGQLYVSWERGQEVFDSWLIDWDPCSEAGNWQWLSASAYFSQYNRVYGAVAFGKKHDKTGNFVRRYIPELKDMPDKYIYEPWKAPQAVQKKANCIIGKDYPEPIVDEQEAKAENLAKIKRAYEFNLHGDDPRVKSREAFQVVRSKELKIHDASPGKRKREEVEDEKKGIKQQKLVFDTQYDRSKKCNAI